MKKKVEFVINDHVNKTVSVFVTTDTKGRPQLFNIVDKDLNDLIQMFVQSIKSVLIDKEYIIENYSTSLKRGDVLYVYDIDDKHTYEMETMEEVVGIQVPEYFDQSVTRIEKINGCLHQIKKTNGVLS